ncbi:MAG TPA: EAL domain-containing protein [Novosphingobium sp.]|nr:EAL domain-containing protein [Novosphingobium sp.]
MPYRFAPTTPAYNGKVILREQVEDNLRHVPAAVLGGMVNALACAAAMWPAGHHGAIAVWSLAVAFSAGMRLWLSRERARSDYRDIAPERDARRIEAISLVYGCVWGVGIALAGSVANATQFCILALLSGGMMGAAVLSFSAMARGAVLFMTPIALGTIAAWWLFPLADARIGALFSCTYLMILTHGAFERQGEFIKRLEAGDALRDTAATVQLLLNDFESQTADWLWEVDAAGRIVAPNTRFAEAAGIAATALEGRRFIGLFAESSTRRMLDNHLANCEPFRHLAVSLDSAEPARWWRLSARPMPGGGMRGVATDITAQKRAEARVNHMAHYDGLTDLANRTLFNDLLRQALERRRHSDGAVAVLYLDLDRFKSVNDTLGHPIGDKLLCEVARRIENAVRKDDTVARLGGDEFALLIRAPNAIQVAEGAARRIIEAVREPCVLDGMQVLTSTSVGIAVAGPGAQDAATLMKRADLALYCAKAEGRNCFAHFEPGMDEAVRERLMLEADLREALQNGDFLLHYQPVIDVASGHIVGHEALVRWHHPVRGIIYPGQFIALAEETGLIAPLGEWVARRAIADLAEWAPHLWVAINISPSQLRDDTLACTIAEALAEHGQGAHRLELEITEGALIHETQAHAATLHRLRDMGVRIALDDFGTGYSSLNHLRSFPFHKIKIDRCFVEELDDDDPRLRGESLHILRTVIGLAQGLGMLTTAEGVERPGQLAVLEAQGCQQAQGYLLARPGAAGALLDEAPHAAGDKAMPPAAPADHQR